MFSLALQNGSKTTEEMENGWTLISLEDLWGDHHCFCRGLGFLGLFEWDALPPFQQRINKEAFETWMDKIITSAAGSCIFLTLMKRIWKGVQGLGHHNLNAKSQTRVETHLSHLEPVFIAVSAVIAGSMRTAKFLLAIGYYYVTKLLGRKTAPFFKSVNHTITLVWVKTAPHGWFPLRPQLSCPDPKPLAGKLHERHCCCQRGYASRGTKEPVWLGELTNNHEPGFIIYILEHPFWW